MRGFYPKALLFISPFFILYLLTSCHPPSPSLTHLSQNVMTIDYHITIGDPLTPKKRAQVQHIIDATFDEINAIYNKWNPYSELSLLNDLPAETPFKLSPQLHLFFQRVESLVELSEGRFDPTVEPIQQLWKTKLSHGTVPTKEEIELLKPSIGWSTLRIEEGVITKQDARTQIDLGGVAKGYSVDLLIERLSLIGLRSLYVEWGGEIRTYGLHPANRPWRVFISQPSDPNPAHAIATVDIIDKALATSGDYFQYWTVRGENGEKRTYCHVFNPLTLAPLEVKENSVASASLLATDCTTADALAKVLMLFDSIEEANRWIKKLQIRNPELTCWIVTRQGYSTPRGYSPNATAQAEPRTL